MKVACYIDGFNLYHAIKDLNKPHLKWLNLRALAESICRQNETLVKIAYFSAYATWRPDAYARHRAFVAALRCVGVECHMARFSEKSASCFGCDKAWKTHEEKETDVHFALTFLDDGFDQAFDRAVIISATICQQYEKSVNGSLDGRYFWRLLLGDTARRGTC